MKTIHTVELTTTLTIFIISLYEFIGVYLARRKGLTKNLSRIITHLVICLIAIVLFMNSIGWLSYIVRINTEKWQNVTFVNWPFLLISFTMGFLIIYEFLGIYYAKKYKLTKNISRIVTHLILLLLFCTLIYLSIKRWDVYVDILRQPGIPAQQIH